MKRQADLISYETTLVVRSEIEDSVLLKECISPLEKIITENAGKLISKEEMGKRKLAYPIQKQSYGRYLSLVYTGNHEVAKKIEAYLNTQKARDASQGHVLRYLTIRQEAKSSPSPSKVQSKQTLTSSV